MKFLINKTLGLHRGVKRLYLEGVKLEKSGFIPDTPIDVLINEKDKRITILKNKLGKRKISRRTRNDVVSPVLDIALKNFDVFNIDDQLRIVISPKSVSVSLRQQKTIQNKKVKNIIEKISNKLPLKAVSLFHGGGVMDSAIHRGLSNEQINSKLAIAVEIEKKYIDSSVRNNTELFDQDTLIIESPIQMLSVDPKSLEDYSILCCGIPCTGASKAGKSANKIEYAEQHDKAGSMFFYALNWMIHFPIVVIENVPEYLKSMSFQVISTVLKDHGYSLQMTIIEGNDFGALENRKRMVCIATLNELSDYFDIELLSDKKSPCKQKVSDILETMSDDDPRWKTFDYQVEKEKRDREAGKGFKRPLLSGSETKVQCIGAGYAKMRGSDPFLVHPNKPEFSRIFTPLENSRLKTIPEKLIEGNCATTSQEILGQSVIYNAFIAVGELIGSSLKRLCQSFISTNNTALAA